MDAIILAGGKGTRLAHITHDTYPKGLIKIGTIPLLGWQLSWLAREKVKNIIFAIGHMSEQIIDYFGTTYETNHGSINIQYSIETKKLGSGGAVKLASQNVSSRQVLLVNGDIITNTPLKSLQDFHFLKKCKATMLLVLMPSPYGVIELENNMIVDFIEKPILNTLIHSGIDILNSDILPQFPDEGQMEDTIFPILASERQFGGYQMDKNYFWRSIDSPSDFAYTRKNFPGLKNNGCR